MTDDRAQTGGQRAGWQQTGRQQAGGQQAGGQQASGQQASGQQASGQQEGRQQAGGQQEGGQQAGALAVVELTFGWRGNSQPHLLEGWAAPEDGFTWSVGSASRVRVPAPPAPEPACELLLELQLNPFAAPGLPAQRLAVLANGVPVSVETLSGEGTVAYRLPLHALQPGPDMLLELRHPDAARPSDLGVSADSRQLAFALRAIRILHARKQPAGSVMALPRVEIPLPRDRLGDAVRAATGLEPDGLVQQFEGLGHNCEFGLMQRHVGADPLSLLRFVGVTMDDLLAALADGFDRAGDHVELRPVPAGEGRTEYIIHDTTYNVSLHTFQMTDEAPADQIRAQHARRMQFLRGHFRTHLVEADRIFVFQRRGRITRSQAVPLLTRLRSFGPNALLYVDQDPGLPSGAVEQLAEGFFHGSMERTAPVGEAGNVDLAAWLSICANAYRLWTMGRKQAVLF